MIARLKLWWSGRDMREQSLIGVMLGLISLFVVWFAVITPLNRARAEAVQRLSIAATDAGRITQIVDRIDTARRLPAPPLTGGITLSIGAMAAANGFTLARLDQSGPSRATIGIVSARPKALFTLLAQLERQGIIVERLTLRANSDATLFVDGVLRARSR